MPRGRPGRSLTDLEYRHLDLLLKIRKEWWEYAQLYDARLEDFVLEMLESGASVRGLADRIHVSTRTIQDWAIKARGRRASGGLEVYNPIREEE